jgi:hypothetical protein
MALNFPDTPSNGQVYLGENGIQYTYNLTNDSWTGKLQSSNVPIDPSPADVSVTPAFGNPSGTNPGSGTLADPFIITNSIVPTLGGSTESLQTITITNGKAGDQVIFTNNTTPTTIAPKYAQAVGVIDGNGKWTGKLTYNDSLGAETTANITYTGNLQVGNTTVYFRWVVQQQATPPMIVTVGSALTGQALIGTELGATQPTVTGGILPYTYSYRWQTSDNGADFTGILNATSNVYTLVVSDIGKYIRCAATVSDSSTIQIVNITSNTAIVNAMSIDVSLSTTTPKAGDTITATAVTAGGVAPVTTSYQWKADDVNIAGATSTTYTVIEADKDKRLSCLVTTTDTSGTSVSKSSDPTDPVFSGSAPEINTVTLTEVTPDSPDRYTDQSFTVAVDMTSDNPKSDFALKGKVLGDLSVDISTSVITGVTIDVVPSGFNPVIYTGNPSGAGRGPVDVGFAPDLVWIKRRNGAAVSHNLMNSLLPDKKLKSDTTDGVADAGAFAFTSNGFQPSASYEQSYGDKYVAWCWDAGDSTVTNNDGATQSTVRSNGYFSVVQASIGALTTIGHGLSATPDLVIAKCSSTTSPWFIQLPGVMATGTNLAFTANAEVSDNFWSSPQTATTLKINANTNVSGTSDWIFYCWAAETGKSSFGLYTGNGGSNAIACGFEPSFIMIKSTSNNEQWEIVDNARNTSNPRNSVLYPNLSAAEVTGSTFDVDFTSTGFTLNNADGGMNYSGYTYIYAAFGGSSDATTLQLTDNTGLALLNAQDAVVQNSGGTPVTSAITNVNQAAGITTQVPVGTTGDWDGILGVNPDGSTSGPVAIFPDGQGVNSPKGYIHYVNMNIGQTITLFGTATGSSNRAVYGDVQETVVNDFNTNLTVITVTTSATSGSFKIDFNQGANVYGITPGPGKTVLTLTDDTNLANFRVGDQLNGGSGFNPVIYAGNSSTQNILCGFAPDFVWLKDRTNANAHWLYDSVSGVDYYLQSNTTAGQQGGGTSYVSSFNSDGFTLENADATNKSGSNYVSWCWDAGDTTVTNNAGTVQSQVRSNGNFSIVSFASSNASAVTVGHGLNSAPKFYTCKSLISGNWYTYVPVADPASGWMALNTSAALNTATPWGAAATDTVFSFPIDFSWAEGDPVIAYCWAETAGVSSFGSYTGNGLAAGPVIDCGFTPAFVMVKSSTAAGTSWNIVDSARGVNYQLYADLSNAENTLPGYVEFTSTGFKVTTISGDWNGTGETFIYAAFAGSSTVTSINEAANQMTVDVGSFTTGNLITGPTLPAASGTVSSVDTTANTLTVAGSSGRWLITESDYNTALKLNKFVFAPDSVQQVTSLFTVMDNSGNISDLSVEDPGYTTMIGDPTYTTTFPSVFPSGETPDVELPPGTKYQVEVKATNTLGSNTKFSNDVMPVAGLLQSSVITANDTSTGIYSSTSTLNVTSGSSIVNAFDGDLTTSVNAGVTTSYTWLTQASLTINTQMRIYTGNGGVTLDYRINGAEYQNVAVANQAGWTIVPFTGVANGIEIKTQGSSMLVNAVEVDGTILLDSTTVLTTADNTNYNLFSAGDAVVESSGGTPITSAITSITDKSYNTFPNGYVNNMMGLYLNQSVQRGLVLSKLLDGSDVAVSPASHGIGTSAIGGPGDAWVIGDVLNVALDAAAGKVWYGINGTWLCSGTPSSGSGMMIQAPVNSPMYFQSTTQLPQSRGCSFGINRVAEYTIPTGFTLFTGSWLNGGEASATDAPDSTGQWPVAKTYAEFKYLSAADAVSGPGGANLINLGFTNGPATGDVYVLLQLSLQNDTNLANFRVGDVVQGSNPDWNQSQEWSTTGTVTGTALSIDSDITKAFDGNITGGSGALLAAANNFVQYVFSPPITISTASYFISMDGGSIVFNVGESDEVTDTTLSGVIVERPLSLASGVLKSFRATTNGSTQGAYLWGVKTNSKLLVDKSVPDTSAIKVTAINEATPSITTNGGSWSGTDGTGDNWNQSQDWSQNNTGFAAAGLAKDAFDGSTVDTGYNRAYAADPGTYATVTFASALTVSTSLRVWVGSGSTQPNLLKINGNAISGSFPSVAGGWFTVPGISSLSSISVGRNSDGTYGDYTSLYAVEVDGQMLVDSGVAGAETSVTGPAFPAATGTISAVDSTNSKLTFSETTGRWLVTQSDYDTAKKLNTKVVLPLVLDQGNAVHVALFNAINTSLTAYPTDKQTFVDALRTKVSGLSLTTPELQVLCTASHTLIKRFVVTVAAYSGSNYFYIDGVRQATLALKKGTTYIFDQDEATNAGHPLKIYTDANKTTEYTSGVTIVGTPGSALSRTAFLVPTNAPATLYYQCSNHAGMGGQLNIS